MLNLVFPKFNNIFSDPFSAVPLAILYNYPTYIEFLSASKSDVINLITSTVNHSTEWAEKRYNMLLNLAKEAELLKLEVDCLGTEMICFIDLLKAFKSAISNLKEKILEVYTLIPDFKENVDLLCSHPEVGQLSAISLLAEIGEIKKLLKCKKTSCIPRC